MKTTQKGYIVPVLIIIIAILVIGGGIYLYTKNKSIPTTSTQATSTAQVVDTSTSTNPNVINAASYIPGKVFINTAASGEIGKFNPDHTITIEQGHDYDPSKPTEGPVKLSATWNIKGNTLIISAPAGSQGSYDFDTIQKQKVGTTTVVGEWDKTMDSQPQIVGFFIGDSLNTISAIANVSFFKHFDIK